MASPWQWLNQHRLVDAVQPFGSDARGDIADVLDRVLAKPFEPDDVEITTLKVDAAHLERRIAWLPHGLFMTYRPYLDGPPPYTGRHVVVLAVNSVEDLFHRLFEEDE